MTRRPAESHSLTDSSRDSLDDLAHRLVAGTELSRGDTEPVLGSNCCRDWPVLWWDCRGALDVALGVAAQATMARSVVTM